LSSIEYPSGARPGKREELQIVPRVRTFIALRRGGEEERRRGEV